LKVLVTGSRNYSNRSVLWGVLRKVNPDFIVEGGATGADVLAREWAISNSIQFQTHNADWKTHGRAAGAIRNQEMLDKHPDIDLVLAFPLPGSRGTWDMVNKSKRRGIEVRIVGDE
jgi:hypothetical protein